MKRLVAMVVAAGAAVAAVAMPTKAELQKAQAMVNDVTATDVAALRTKSKTPTEVAAKHMELAGQAGSEAEKYLLLQGAFKLYAKAGDYDAAANVIEKLQAEITDYDPEVTVELCGAEFIRKMRENAPRLYALKENARRIVFYRKQLPIREAAVKKNPKDAQAQRKLAECHAELGDWPKALDVFVKAGGEFKKMAEGETSGKVPAQELGDFWWDYETKSDTQVYKLHAAELYRKALADDSFKGLARTRAEQRVKEVAGNAAAVAADGQGTSPRTSAATGLYCVIDLSGGPDAKKYPVSYLNDMPKGGWSDEYKTTKLVLRRIEPGKPVLVGRGSEQRRTSVSEPYYLGVFEVTQGQWEQVMGTRPSFWRGKDYKKRPVECVSYDLIRGKNKGGEWPKSNEVDPGSFLGCLREKSGVAFDLPVERQWEYACAAGTETDYNNGGSCTNYHKCDAMDVVGRYQHNGGWNRSAWGKFEWNLDVLDRESDTMSGTAAVGTYSPNKWGFYDMHGNVWEWCLDYGDDSKTTTRVVRSSWWLDVAAECCTFIRKESKPTEAWVPHGLRLCLPLAGGAATQAPATTPALAAKVGKAWQEKGSEATLDLGEKYGKLEFVKCPAGRVDMVVFQHGETCKVNISRPFWIMKRPLTRKQMAYLPQCSYGEGYSFELRERTDEFVDLVMDNFGASLPKKYVLRLPTLAEWEYAFHANTRNRDDPYFDLLGHHPDDEVAKKIYNFPYKNTGRRNVANAWGLTDFQYEKVLDKFNYSELNSLNAKEGGGIHRIPNPTEKVDPLYWTADGGDQVYISKIPDWTMWQARRLSDEKSKTADNTPARLVIGPDLVSEWKAKHKK